jgi:hypothetical protein
VQDSVGVYGPRRKFAQTSEKQHHAHMCKQVCSVVVTFKVAMVTNGNPKAKAKSKGGKAKGGKETAAKGEPSALQVAVDALNAVTAALSTGVPTTTTPPVTAPPVEAPDVAAASPVPEKKSRMSRGTAGTFGGRRPPKNPGKRALFEAKKEAHYLAKKEAQKENKKVFCATKQLYRTG